jgi:hypothetical protein
VVLWLLPRLWRTLKRLFQRIGRFFGGRARAEPELHTPEERNEAMRNLFPASGKPIDHTKK